MLCTTLYSCHVTLDYTVCTIHTVCTTAAHCTALHCTTAAHYTALHCTSVCTVLTAALGRHCNSCSFTNMSQSSTLNDISHARDDPNDNNAPLLSYYSLRSSIYNNPYKVANNTQHCQHMCSKPAVTLLLGVIRTQKLMHNTRHRHVTLSKHVQYTCCNAI